MKSGYGRTDYRIPDVEKQIILEETQYLLDFGYRADDADIIKLGMRIAAKTFEPKDWISISDETLRWHCKNFYTIGFNYALAKEHTKRDRT